MKALLYKEIRSYLSSIIGYTAIGVFLLSSGFFVWIFPGSNNIIDMGESNLVTIFSQAPWNFVIFISCFYHEMFC